MLNNNVTLTVQLTDVKNAPKNADGSNKTYRKVKTENNYRVWILNYKSKTNLLTITGTLVTHTDLVCQVGGEKNKYITIKADSLNNTTRVTFCIKAPKGFADAFSEQPSLEILNFNEYFRVVLFDVIKASFDKQLNSFIRISDTSSLIYSRATKDSNASLTCFISLDDLNLFDGDYSFVNRLTCLTRSTAANETLELS